MPRQRRIRQKHVDLARLIDRARHHPYNVRRRKAEKHGRNGASGGNSSMRMLWNKNVTPQQAVITAATTEQPIFSAQQHQRLLQHVPSASASVITVRSSNSQLHLAFGEVEIPCCATEAPVATIMHIPALRRQRAAVPPIHHDQLSTIVLHRNPYFDGEGTTRSGLLKPHNSKTDISPAIEEAAAKSKYLIAKKGISNKIQRKNCDSDGSSVSYVSIHGRRRGSDGGSSDSRAAKTCSASMVSSDNSEKSKSDSDESNSFDGNNDDCMTMALKASTKFNLTLDMRMEIERGIALQAAASPINPTTTTTTTGMPPDRDEELPPPPNSPAVPHTATTTCNLSANSNNTLANILESVDNFLKTVTPAKIT